MAKRIESGDGQNITCAHTWPVCTISTDNLLRKPYLKQLPFLKPKSTFIQVFIQVMCTGAGGQGSPVECLFSMKQTLNTRPRNRFRILTKYPNWAPRTRAWDPDALLSPDSTLFERHICRIRQAVLTVVPGRQGRQNRSGMSLKRWQETATQVQDRWLESRVWRELQKVWERWNDSGSEWFQGRGQGGLISVFSGPREKCTSKENLCISMFNQWAVQKSQKFTYSLHTSESVYGGMWRTYIWAKMKKQKRWEELGTEQPDRGQGRHSWDQRPWPDPWHFWVPARWVQVAMPHSK